ncbi:Yip1 family protein [Myxosarcina sp. GI1(2024)]
MLDSVYAAFFRPGEIRFPTRAAIAIGLLVVLVLALNAAGKTNSDLGSIIGFVLLFLFAGVLGWYWLAASVNLIAQLLGGQGDGRTTLEGIARGLWPLLFTGPALAAANWSIILGQLFSLAVTLGVFITLIIAIRHIHRLSWLKASLCLVITLILSGLALSGLFLWPLMIILGT